MVVHAPPALAHHAEIDADVLCTGEDSGHLAVSVWTWTSDSDHAGRYHSEIQIEVEGSLEATTSFLPESLSAFEAARDNSDSSRDTDPSVVSNDYSGPFDAVEEVAGFAGAGAERVVLIPIQDAWKGTTVTIEAGPNTSLDWWNGQNAASGDWRSTTVEIPVDCADLPVPQVTPVFGCEITWTGSQFIMYGTLDFTVSDPAGIDGITVTPKSGGDASISGATWTGNEIELLPWAYEWDATVADGYVGEAPSGEFDLDRDWYSSCSCPEGTIDLSDTGVLRANSSVADSLKGEPASPVTIAAGYYEIYLGSYDDHSHKPNQTQPEETWALANAEDGTGSFESPGTGDLPNDLNFMSYHVTSSTGPVFVPDFSAADLWTVHTAAPSGNVNSIQPACAQLIEDVRQVTVDVEASSCQVDGLGNPVGDITVTMAPDAEAEVSVYSDEAKTNLVATLNASDTIEDLAPGTYYWEATASPGYELTGPSEGEVTIEDCTSTVSVTTDGVCEVDEEIGPTGVVEIGITPGSSATVGVYSDAELQNLVFDTSSGGSFDLAPGTYYWEATAGSGFEMEGPTSGNFTIDDCSVTITVGAGCEVVEGQGVGQISVTMSTVGAATVTITNAEAQQVGNPITGSATIDVAEGATYGWEAIAADGFEIQGDAEGEVDVETCTPEPELGRLVVEKVVPVGDTGQVFDFTVEEADWDFQLGNGDDDFRDVAPGTYTVEEVELIGWDTVVSCGGVAMANPAVVDIAADETVTCTFTNIPVTVQASVLVTVSGACVPDGDDGFGRITVEMSVDGAGTVVVRDSDGDVVGSRTSSGTITVPEGDTYTWEATASEGFEFPVDFDTTGQVTISTCSEGGELPFTGVNAAELFAIATILLGGGSTLILSVWRREEN